MNLRNSTFVSTTLIMILAASGSCRPPMPDYEQNPGLRMDRESVSGPAGQSNPGAVAQTYYNLGDARPTAIKQADNPDYDPTSKIFVTVWNAMFGGEGTPPPHQVEPPQPMPQDIGNDLDAYDIQGGKVNVGSDPSMENDPDIARYIAEQARQNEELNKLNKLKEQRDYLQQEANKAVTSFNQQEVAGFNAELGQEFDKMEGEIDDSITSHNKNVDSLIYGDGVHDDANDKFQTEKGSNQGEKVRGAASYAAEATSIVSTYPSDRKETALAFVKMAEASINQADNFYYQGRNQEGDASILFSFRFISVALGLIPGSDTTGGSSDGPIGFGELNSSPETKSGQEIRNEYTRLEYVKLNQRIMTAEQQAHLQLAEEALQKADHSAGSRTDKEIENILAVAHMEGDVAEGKVTNPPQTKYGWPLANGAGKGNITTRFNAVDKSHPNPHGGIDIGVPKGTAVTSPVYGVVTSVGSDPDGFGNYIIIQHTTPDGSTYQTIMAHNSSVAAQPGAYVSEGQVIAVSGNTGNSTGAHVHLEIRDCTGRKNCNFMVLPSKGGPPRVNPETLF